MGWRGRLRDLAERVTDTRIFRTLPHGVDPLADIRRLFPDYRPGTVADVGAHHGESASALLRAFPQARIHCFEPVGDSFARLARRFADDDRVECHALALGLENRRGHMALGDASDLHRLLPLGASASATDGGAAADGAATISSDATHAATRAATNGHAPRLQPVTVTSLDRFCSENDIHAIGYLKIDTEGGDLSVLEGAEALLRSQAVDFLQLECGMNRHNGKHVAFATLQRFLEDRDYYVLGLYEQMSEWHPDAVHLRRVNPLFVSRRKTHVVTS